MSSVADREQAITPETKRKLRAQLQRAIKRGPRQIESMAYTRRLLKSRGKLNEARVLNVVQFTLLYVYDVNCLMDDVLKQGTDLRAKLYARMLLLVVQESLQKLRHLLGRQFRSAVEEIDSSGEMLAATNEVHSTVTKLFERVNRQYGDIRNGVIAHRDDSAERQMDLINQTSIREAADLTIELGDVTNSILAIGNEYTDGVIRREGRHLEDVED